MHFRNAGRCNAMESEWNTGRWSWRDVMLFQCLPLHLNIYVTSVLTQNVPWDHSQSTNYCGNFIRNLTLNKQPQPLSSSTASRHTFNKPLSNSCNMCDFL